MIDIDALKEAVARWESGGVVDLGESALTILDAAKIVLAAVPAKDAVEAAKQGYAHVVLGGQSAEWGDGVEAALIAAGVHGRARMPTRDKLKREALARLTQSDGQLRAYGLAAADRIRTEIIIPLESELSRLREALAKAERTEQAQMAMLLGTIGGIVEGYPTSRINYLQRLRQLIEAETRAVSAEALLAEAAARLDALAYAAEVMPSRNSTELLQLSEEIDRARAFLDKIKQRKGR